MSAQDRPRGQGCGLWTSWNPGAGYEATFPWYVGKGTDILTSGDFRNTEFADLETDLVKTANVLFGK